MVEHCLLCHYQTISSELLIKHVIRYHKNDPRFKIKCTLSGCGATFKKWRAFKNHILKNHPRRVNLINELPIADNEEGNQMDENEEENAGTWKNLYKSKK